MTEVLLPKKDGVSDREYFEAILREQARALSMAEAEREKAASALRDSLERARQEGDDRLRDHITAQVLQIRTDLASADKLELERVGRVEEAMLGLRREQKIYEEGSKEAILKAEAATEKRLESVNAFRSQWEERQKAFISREVIEGLLETVKVQVVANEKRIGVLENLAASQQGVVAGSESQMKRLYALIGGVAAILGIVIVLANVLTGT